MDTLPPIIAAQRARLADTLAALPESRWNEPTLCAGWRVREVIAHVTMPFRYSTRQFLWHFALAGGNFTRLSNRRATADAATLSATQLTAAVRDNANHPWKPPGGGLPGALTHDTVHALDVTIALGLDWTVPAETLRPVLDGWSVERGQKIFGVDLTGVRLVADDLDWSAGDGEPLTGSGSALLMVLAGRRLPAGHLHGAPAGAFQSS
ncbi:maleylpyruvate isomerase family mycothiol-dependent enzyme [Cryptosporangium phraense]|uniref:Maleylpyruvate isomerase family mycothiol-dependent enzyme n=1 Tax=Cryptosporangium phraense TaxID=2593070 RepID=A0A545ASW4_9ACTN|nr:maleylpyruvate isomerase family mycothiol-dependent enzyme [Cryptosporangium phraense]TQS44403.1 maleylpyruvate isomerase family mycothiol-dependent enzyme [Cryptosporangium phraense]